MTKCTCTLNTCILFDTSSWVYYCYLFIGSCNKIGTIKRVTSLLFFSQCTTNLVGVNRSSRNARRGTVLKGSNAALLTHRGIDQGSAGPSGRADWRATPRDAAYCVALEGLEGPVAAEATHVDAHVGAAGGEGGVVLPVDVQGRRCVERNGAERALALMRRRQSAAARHVLHKRQV